MNVLDLFSGIGAFSLGLERAGMRTVAFCEIDPFARRVLAKHWPEVPCYDDVRSLSADRLRADGIAVDVICGGFPCQDISVAGRGAGINAERSGLWSEFARLIGEVRPQYAIIENVAALLGRGLVAVLGDLAACGYDAEWRVVSAADVGAPHLRERVWVVAYPSGAGRQQIARSAFGDESAHEGRTAPLDHQPPGDGEGNGTRTVAYSNGPRCQGQRLEHRAQWHAHPEAGWSGESHDVAHANGGGWREQGHLAKAPSTQSAGQSGNGGSPTTYANEIGCPGSSPPAGGYADDGGAWGGAERSGEALAIPSRPRLAIGPGTLREWAHTTTTGDGWWAVERSVCRVVDGPADRVDRRKRLMGLGNSLVPQIPELIGRAIFDYEAFVREELAA